MNYTAGDIHALFQRLMEAGAIKIDTVRGFRLKHHDQFPESPLSPIYINLRVPENNGPLKKQDVDAVAYLMFQYLQHHRIQFEGICGVPRAGEPFAKALQEIIYHSLGYSVPVLTLQKEEKNSVRKVGGLLKAQELPRGCKVLVVDDLITTALSKLEALNVLRHEGYLVNDCLVFLDREQHGRDEMAKHGVSVHSIASFTSMTLFYKDHGLISADQDKQISAYKKHELSLLTA